MDSSLLLDPYKLRHWLNARKFTPTHVASASGVERSTVDAVLAGDRAEVNGEDARRLAKALDVEVAQLVRDGGGAASVVHLSSADLHASRRPIQRDGIHFYNYYSLPTPKGRVGPVILDILCPPGRIPALNNGHLEPAMTLNLGPGDIHGRWGEELDDATWGVLEANRSGEHEWVVGDSYLEPSYLPHSYSLCSDQPARIVSYTAPSNLTGLLTEANSWPEHAFRALVVAQERAGSGNAVLALAMQRRAHTPASLAALAGIDADRLAAQADGSGDALSVDDLRAVGAALQFDYRLFLPPTRHHDRVGKTCFSWKDGVAGRRSFASYTVASMAGAPHLPDLVGMFLEVDGQGRELDLLDHGPTHYLVTAGSVVMRWLADDGTVAEREMGPDDSVWVAPCVAHGFGGHGALAKFGNGEGYGYLQQVELANTVDVGAMLRRGWRDGADWGYEDGAGKGGRRDG